MTDIKEFSINQQKTLRKLRLKKFRYHDNKYFCEGYHYLETALEQGAPVQEVIVSQSILSAETGQRIYKIREKNGFQLYVLKDRPFLQLSDEKSPSGILFTVTLKQNSYTDLLKEPDANILYLDKISDPGNLGTLLRTASWFNITTILLSPECVDPYNPKAVRSSAGAIFSCNIYCDIPFDAVLRDFKSRAYQIVATIPSKGTGLNQWRINTHNIILFGQEADGLSPDIIQNADVLVTIKGSPKVESLNVSVSAGIILHHLASRVTN
jgi:TrmH family RNA methyltransferase